MNLDKALQIPGWMTPGELQWLAEQASQHTSIVEIGSWRGRSCRAMADNSEATIFCVDTWDDDAVGYAGWWTEKDPAGMYAQKDWLFNEFKNHLSDHIGPNVVPVRMDSISAANFLSYNMMKFDMIFIDAGHNYEEVIKDIIHWKPLLKPGGLLCGHDYNHPQCPDVNPAVNSLIKNVKVFETIWREECDIVS